METICGLSVWDGVADGVGGTGGGAVVRLFQIKAARNMAVIIIIIVKKITFFIDTNPFQRLRISSQDGYIEDYRTEFHPRDQYLIR